MKKRIVTLMMASCLVLSMTACGSNEKKTDKPKKDIVEEQKEPVKKEVKRDFPEGEYTDMGNGEFSIQTAGGDSADGIIPVLFVEQVSEGDFIQIGYASRDMDGTHITYIYVDGMENDKDQLGGICQSSLVLQGNALSEGVHTVEAVQFDTDEPDGAIITYKSCKYEVKIMK